MGFEKNFWTHWNSFLSDVLQRLKKPFRHPAFCMYFVVFTLGVGGIGVWIEAIKAILNPTFEAMMLVPRTLSTYLLAVIATAAADLVMSDLVMPEEQTKRYMRMFALASLVVGTALGVVGLNISFLKWAYGCAILGTILALLLWWLANAANSKFLEQDPPVDAATGGDPDQNLAGNLDGLQA